MFDCDRREKTMSTAMACMITQTSSCLCHLTVTTKSLVFNSFCFSTTFCRQHCVINFHCHCHELFTELVSLLYVMSDVSGHFCAFSVVNVNICIPVLLSYFLSLLLVCRCMSLLRSSVINPKLQFLKLDLSPKLTLTLFSNP